MKSIILELLEASSNAYNDPVIRDPMNIDNQKCIEEQIFMESQFTRPWRITDINLKCKIDFWQHENTPHIQDFEMRSFWVGDKVS